MASATARRAAKRTPMEELVATITTYQSRFEMSDAMIAEKIGVPRTTWTSIRTLQYPPRLEFAQRAARVMEFRAAALDVLVPPASEVR